MSNTNDVLKEIAIKAKMALSSMGQTMPNPAYEIIDYRNALSEIVQMIETEVGHAIIVPEEMMCYDPYAGMTAEEYHQGLKDELDV